MSLRVLAFVPHPPAGASGRYRIWKMAEPLAREGISLAVRLFLDEVGVRVLYERGAIARKASAMAADAARRRELGTRARATVEAHYSPDHVAPQLANLLRRAVDGGRAGA